MVEEHALEETVPSEKNPVLPVRTRRALLLALLCVALVVIILALRRTLLDDDLAVEPRDAPVADLLAWIPADDFTRHAFAVWTPDPGDSSTDTAMPLDLIDQLGLAPQPGGLGRELRWLDTYGWTASQVTAWASAGPNGELAVLAGAFDGSRIGDSLREQGYVREDHRGAQLWLAAEPSGPAYGPGALALLNDRIILADSPDRARAALDAALDGEGSLADDSTIDQILEAMAPLSALVAVSQANHAAACSPNTIAPSTADSGLKNYVMIGYGRAGEPSVRRTLVATSFPSDSAATAARAAYETGWLTGFANAGGAGGSIEAFGRFNFVAQSGNVLLAELIEGRDEGWVRAGVRFAIPVCEVALGLAPPATPDASGGQAILSTMQRLVASLPETGTSGVFRALDLGAVATATGTSPDLADSEVREQWWNAAAPLPSFTVFPGSPTLVTRLAETLGIQLESLVAIGEAQRASDDSPVGALIGDWDLANLSATFGALGYGAIELDGVRHFALPVDAGGASALTAAAGPAWENIAVQGDRMWVSADQRELRQAVDAATGGDPGAVSRAAGFAPFTVLPNITALELVGAEYIVDACGSVYPGITAVGAAWTAQSDGGQAAIFYLPNAEGTVGELASVLETRLPALRLSRLRHDDAGAGTPVPVDSVAFSDVLERSIAGELADSAGTPSAEVTAIHPVVSRWQTLDRASIKGVEFFEGLTGACDLTTIR